MFRDFGDSRTRTNRPIFSSNQIKNVSELKRGMKVLVCSSLKNHKSYVAILTISPDQNEKGEWFIHYKREEDKIGLESRTFLCDHSVVSYEDGRWNNANWLEKI
ncbi:MAG: hypothetical protein HY044_00230 [Candidatus Woesebacteria bacterium]|nr:MAG: hypothetical protein HY044_00230 [Candidatus Woesebacteria bacterium]